MTDLFRLFSPLQLYIFVVARKDIEDSSQGKGLEERVGLGWVITYPGIELKDLVAAIKSFWFDTARQIICAFFPRNKPVRFR